MGEEKKGGHHHRHHGYHHRRRWHRPLFVSPLPSSAFYHHSASPLGAPENVYQLKCSPYQGVRCAPYRKKVMTSSGALLCCSEKVVFPGYY